MSEKGEAHASPFFSRFKSIGHQRKVNTLELVEPIDLAKFGSGESGYSLGDAAKVMLHLEHSGFHIYGIEAWERTEAGYCVDGLSGWYSDASKSRQFNFADAFKFLGTLRSDGSLVVTIQSG